MSEELIGSKFNIKTKFLWHSTQIYCLAFDKRGKFIFTGGDDGVLRVYSIAKDRLIKCLSDQTDNEFANEVEEVCRTIDFETNTEANIEELLEQFAICDIAVNHENTLLSAGKHNGSILVWNLQSFELIIKFDEQMFPIRSVLFSPAVFDENKKYLISTSEDGFIFFYVYNHNTLEFQPKSLHRRSKYDGERAVNICVDMTTGGLLLGLLHTFGIKREVSRPKSKKEPILKSDIQSAIRIFSLCDEMGLKEEWKSTYHKLHSNCVYSLRFAHNSFRFASACDKDSNAFIWTFDKSNKKWDSIIIGINTTTDSKKLLRGKSKQSFKTVFVEEIAFSCDDKYMITVLTDVSVKVWNSESGELVKHFKELHSEKVSVVDCHPTYGHIFLSAGYDSNIYIFDITEGTILQHFDCNINSQQIVGNSLTDDSICVKPLLLQCSFSPDGQAIASTDNYGNLTIFSLESRKETESLDQLEEFLCKIHSESEEEIEIGITASEDNSKFIKAMFEYETDLLKGIEKPSPLKKSPKVEDKRSDVKFAKKLDFDTDSSANQLTKVKSSPVSNSPKKTPKKRIIGKKSITTTTPNKTEAKDSPSLKDKDSPNSSKARASAVGPKQTKQIIKSILDEIFENPSSRPFQINDEIQYPTFRKEISDADLSLTSIREEMGINNRYTLSKFNKDLNKVIENAKKFYKEVDEEVYDMALTLEGFYCNKMKTQFGSSFKPPLSFDLSDDEMSDNSCDEKTALQKPVPKNVIEDNRSEKSVKNSEIEKNSTSLRSKSVPKDSPKVNGKQTPKRLKTKDKIVKNSGSNRKRNTTKDKIESDSEPTPGKRTKTSEEESNSSPIDEKEEETQNQNNFNNEDIPEDNQKHIEVDTHKEQEQEEEEKEKEEEEPKLCDSPAEEPNNIGIQTEQEVQTPVEESTSRPETVVNGTPTADEINSCDNGKESTQLKNCLFCVFCEKIFWSLSAAKSHYISHLCPLKCSNCKQSFTRYEQYLSHDCEHSKTPQNIEWCRHYSDSINWIEKFLNFQQKEEIETFETMTEQKCIVCEKVEQFRPQSIKRIKEIKINEKISHLEKHLKYENQYLCLFCLLDHDNYFYCRNSSEAEQHLSKEHSTHQICDSSLQFFDPSIPLLNDIILRHNL